MFDNLFEIHERKKNAEKAGIKPMMEEPLTTINKPMETQMSNNKTSLLAKANFHSKNALGSIGRPVAVGAGIGFGSYYAGQKWDVDFLQDGYNCAIVGGVGAVGVELGLATFGDDSDLRAAAAVSEIKDAINNDKDGSLADRLIAAGCSETEAAAIAMASNLLVESSVNADEGNEGSRGKKTKSA